MAEVLFTNQALASLRSHEAYLRERSPPAADRLRADVERCAALLAEFPAAGRPIRGTRSRSRLTSRYRYRLIHVLNGPDVVVLDVLHPRQSGPA